MPRGDGTGPMGQGPMSGRGAGYCAGYGAPGYANPAGGRGFAGRGLGRGWGRGWGRGLGRGYGYGWAPAWGAPAYPVAPMPPVAGAPIDEAAALRDQSEYLQEALEEVQKRLTELEKESK